MNEIIAEALGKAVRDAWLECKRHEVEQGRVIPADHLLSWANLDERNKAIDRRIAEAVLNDFRYGRVIIMVLCKACSSPIAYPLALGLVEEYCEGGFLKLPPFTFLICSGCYREYSNANSNPFEIQSFEV